MAARRKKKAGARKAARGPVARAAAAQHELPRTLDEFSRHVRRGLSNLEARVVKAAAPARREIARALRDASHALGRYEAEGERQWERLTGSARREAIAVLRRMEKALAAPRRRSAGTARRRAA